MTTTTDIRSLAKIAAQSFETRTRDNGDEFYTITDGSPEWVRDLVYAAHGDFLPDDYRYKLASDACEWIADSDDPYETGSEFADEAVDVYTGRRLAWLASNLNRPGYCDEAAATFGAESPSSFSIIDLIGFGQYQEASEVYGLVLNFLQNLEV